jgi:hypothetical protein
LRWDAVDIDESSHADGGYADGVCVEGAFAARAGAAESAASNRLSTMGSGSHEKIIGRGKWTAGSWLNDIANRTTAV